MKRLIVSIIILICNEVFHNCTWLNSMLKEQWQTSGLARPSNDTETRKKASLAGNMLKIEAWIGKWQIFCALHDVITATVYRKEYSSWMINEERSILKTAQKRFRRGVCFINLTKPDHAATSPVSPVRPPQGNTSPLNHQRRTVQSLMVPEVAVECSWISISNKGTKNHIKLLFFFTVQWRKHFIKAQILFHFIFSFQFFRRKRCDRNAETTLARHYFFYCISVEKKISPDHQSLPLCLSYTTRLCEKYCFEGKHLPTT